MPDFKRSIHLISPSGNWEPFTRVVSLAAALRECGYSSAVAAPEHSRLREMAEGAGVDVLPLAVERSINPLRWKELAETVKASGAGIVHAHDADAAALVSRAGMFLQDQRIVTTRYDRAGGLSGAEYGGKAGAVACPSQALADAYTAAGAAPEKVHVVFAGANAAVAERLEEERADIRAFFRERHCPGKAKPLFLAAIAPFDDNGCQLEILEALPEVLAALPQAHLLLMGEGQAREELERRAKLLAVSGDVAFLEPDNAYPRLLAAADLYLAWAKDDQAGIMAQAAMMAGRGVLLRASGCHGELAENGVSAVYDEGVSVNSLKDAVLGVLGDRARREKLGKAAKARAAKLFDSKACAARMAEVYAGIAGAIRQA